MPRDFEQARDSPARPGSPTSPDSSPARARSAPSSRDTTSTAGRRAKPAASVAQEMRGGRSDDTTSAQRASSMWPIAASAAGSQRSSRTRRPDTAWNVSGPTNSRAPRDHHDLHFAAALDEPANELGRSCTRRCRPSRRATLAAPRRVPCLPWGSLRWPSLLSVRAPCHWLIELFLCLRGLIGAAEPSRSVGDDDGPFDARRLAMTLRAWPRSERPRERLARGGPRRPSPTASCSRSCSAPAFAGQPAAELARRLLDEWGSLTALLGSAPRRARARQGLGPARVARLAGRARARPPLPRGAARAAQRARGPGRRGALSQGPAARPAARGVLLPVPRHAPSADPLRGAVPRHDRRRDGVPARGREARARSTMPRP